MLARSDVADRIQYGLVKYVKKAKMVLKVPRSKKETNSITHATGDSRPIQAMVPEGEEGCVSVIIVPADTLKPKILTAFVPQVTGNGITIGTSTTEVFTIDRGPSWPAASNEIIANIHQSIKNISLSFVKGTSIPQTPATAASRSVLQQEKARARVGKYGLNLEPHGCPARGAIGVRVEKPIRSRIHRQCHRCESNFGRDKTCLNCAHKRCTKCPRYPFKESKIKTGPQEALSAPGDIEVSGLEVERRVVEELEVEKVEPVVKEPEITKLDVENLTITPIPILPVITSPANNGDSDLVHKPISQQVHRICHKCETEFFLEEKICAYCGHLRCKSCARDPIDLNQIDILMLTLTMTIRSQKKR
ncbi:MAG: hypothetical protein M1836_007656 [Candelina mexicana]|nr:MAG: hypothetical protein M1836_007656 [Candelina mexicana]